MVGYCPWRTHAGDGVVYFSLGAAQASHQYHLKDSYTRPKGSSSRGLWMQRSVDACKGEDPKHNADCRLRRSKALRAASSSHPNSTSRKQPFSYKMTSFGLSVIVTCILLSIVHGNHKPRCDSHDYGQPQPASCTELILDEIANDRISRLFSLSTYTRPEGITTNQFRRRIELPFLRENGRGSSYFKACRHLLIIIPDGCKIAFLAIRFLNGSVSYDTSIWADIRNEAQRLKRSCGAFATAPLGGNLVVGKITIILSSYVSHHCVRR